MAAGCAGGLDNRQDIQEVLTGDGEAGSSTDNPGSAGGSGMGAGGSEAGSSGSQASGSAGDPSDVPAPEVPDVPKEVFEARCAGCHGDGAPLGGLDLVSPDFAERLGGQDSAACGGDRVIDFDAPERSQLYQRLLEEPDCGTKNVERMPMSSEPLSEKEIGWVLTWIEAGAPDEPGDPVIMSSMDPSKNPEGPDKAPADETPDTGDEPDEDTAEEMPGSANEDPSAGGSSPEGALDRSDWTITSTPMPAQPNASSNAIDGMLGSRFTTGANMQGGEWLRIDMGSPQTFSRVLIDYAMSPMDYFRGYAIYATDNPAPAEWGQAISEGMGDSSGVTDVSFDEVTARYLVIEQTSSDDMAWWSVHEVYAFP